MNLDLDEILDGARAIRTDKGTAGSIILQVWHGGHTVNVYNYLPSNVSETLVETTCYSVGSFEDDEADRQDVLDAMKGAVQDQGVA
jgi:hypothetical protein